jgi:hypothetical protein
MRKWAGIPGHLGHDGADCRPLGAALMELYSAYMQRFETRAMRLHGYMSVLDQR